MTEINHPATVAEVAELYSKYETALCTNDLDTMDALFWDSPEVVRLGATENLYGIEEIRAFRKARGPATLTIEREISNFKVVTFDTDTAVVTLEFYGGVVGKPPRRGRQSQVWRRFPQGWQIVSAHVSWLPEA
ncbi:oxalurate catabolism protein HpxZ [Oscillatoria sp. FACHB-1407]|uniref:oxalurate catabolism protein HpxZ n=1 Tax=Oscillatoria sp. FACHB-1407 TaxID=2692847 RepID=UPI001687F5F3|nr:oxalurate catabolism protein HpxZ [Oscillatoria sp. FACHB-1407]MBD2460281.1 oxalurate catabolism protein HpxZ [Oscillatoria sp. FACHB-1407]